MRATLEQFVWAHPEWWCCASSAMSGAALMAHGLMAADCHEPNGVLTQSWHWVLMVQAMMFPFLTEHVRTVAFRSYPERRHHAVGLFLLGYLAPWTAIGIALSVGCEMLGLHGDLAAASAFAMAAAWSATGVRARAMIAGHGTRPLAPSGTRADVDCLRFGAHVGLACVVTCGPLMTACAIAGHELVPMVAGVAIAALESRSFRTTAAPSIAGAASLALFFATRAFVLPY